MTPRFSTVQAINLGDVAHAGITDAPLYKKTDKSDPMGAQVSIASAIAGQPTERGASPILYAAASPELTGKHSAMYSSALQPCSHSAHPLTPPSPDMYCVCR